MQFFNVLGLPRVALRVLLKCFNPIDLLLLSQCSKQMSKFIQMIGTQKYFLSIEFPYMSVKVDSEYLFGASDPKGDPENSEFQIDINGKPLKVEHSENLKVLHCSWEDYTEGMLELGLYLSDLFKCRIGKFTDSEDLPGDRTLSMLKRIMKRQNNTIERLALIGVFQPEDLKWILENVRVLHNLMLASNITEGFRSNFIPDFEYLAVLHGTWITLENLLTFKSAKLICLAASNFSHKDMNVFMNEWKAGGFPKLEHVWIVCHNWKEDQAILGFSQQEMMVMKSSPRKLYIDGKKIATCSKGVDLQLDDGTKATIVAQILQEGCHFELFVWKD